MCRLDQSKAVKLDRPRYFALVQRAMLRRFCSSSDGSIAVEFALVLPIMLTMLFGSIQFGILFLNLYDLQVTASEAARRVAVGDMTTTEATTFLNSEVNPPPADGEEPPAAVGVNVATVDDRVTVDLDYPMSRIDMLDYLGIMSGSTFSTSVTMRVE